MATSSTGGAAIVCSRRSSSGRLIDSTSRYRSSKVMLLARVKPSFCVSPASPSRDCVIPSLKKVLCFYLFIL